MHMHQFTGLYFDNLVGNIQKVHSHSISVSYTAGSYAWYCRVAEVLLLICKMEREKTKTMPGMQS